MAAGLVLFWKSAPWPDTPDGLFHLHRVRALAEALRMGILYPRWFPDFAFGYGYPVLNFYAPAFYYGPALFHLMGLDVIMATRLSLAIWYALSGLAVIALLRCWTRPTVALVGAWLYLVFPYRLYDLFIRGALPEFAAFLWPPLLILLYVRLAPAAAVEGRRLAILRTPTFLWLSLAWAGLFFTHNLTALMAVFLAVLAIPLLACIQALAPARPGLRAVLADYGKWIGFPLAAGVAIAMAQIMPSIWEARWIKLGIIASDLGFRRHLADWADLLTMAPVFPYPDAAEPTVPLPGYVIIILGIALVMWLFWRALGNTYYSTGRAMPGRKYLTLALVISGTTLFLTTKASSPVWHGLLPLMGRLQFPWRWQAPFSLAFVCVVATLLEAAWAAACRRNPAYSRWLTIASALLVSYTSVYAVLGLAPRPASYTAPDLTVEQMWRFDADHGQVGATWSAEFLPRWVSEQRWALGRAPSTAEPPSAVAPVTFTALPLAQGYLHDTWLIVAPQPVTLRFHRFYYPAWQITVDGRRVFAYPDGPMGLLTFDLGAGTHQVKIQFAITLAVQIGWLCSGVTLLSLSLFALRSHGRLIPIIGLVMMALLTAMIWNPLEKKIYPQPIGADYGPVRLEAIAIGEASPGEMLPVRLYWSVQEHTGSLTAFVHIVGQDGRLITQRDEPLAGPYTPAERWHPGMVLDYIHQVPLPAEMSSGNYTIDVGLYPSGQPEAPLRPLNRPETRLAVGVVTIAPR
jgi:hypothetical protein